MENQKSEKVKEFDPIASLANNRYSLEEETPGFFVSSVRKAIENVDDPEFKDKYGKYIPFFQKISNYLHAKRQYIKIREHLEYSGLESDLYGRKANLYLAFNTFFLFSLVGIFKVFKRTSLRLTGIMSLMVIKSQILDFYACEHQIRMVALEDNDLLSQELRLLYRFYLPDDPDIPEMEEKCEEFKKVMEVKKAIKSSRKEQEERSGY